MSTPIKRPEHTLNRAFEEIDRASQLVTDRQQEVASAQHRVDAAHELQSAAQVQFTNAEARYSVLAKSQELAAPDLERLELSSGAWRTELALVDRQLLLTGAQAETVEQARAALRELFRGLRDLRAEAAGAMEAMRRSLEEIRQRPQQIYKTAAVRNMCDALEGTHNSLRERQDGYEPALRQLEMAIETLSVEVRASDYQQVLETRREEIETRLAEIDRGIVARRPGIDPGELQRARDDLMAARFATEEAPREVQRAQAELQAATISLAQAQAGQQAAQSQLGQIEAQFVTGVELSAPDAAGLMTARAQLSQAIPDGYTLRWQAGPAAVVPATGDVVSIDTGQLPVGDTAVEAQLVRDPAIA